MTDGDLPVADEADVRPADDNVTILPVLTAPGGRLRAAREAAGLGIGNVVEALRVEPHLVEAMEANRFELFDAPVYARGFLRKYSEFLSLSAADMLAEFDSLASRPAAPTHVPLTTAAPRVRDWSRIQSALVIAGALVVVIGSFLWWHSRGSAPAPTAAADAVPVAVTRVPPPAPVGPPVAGESPAPADPAPLPADAAPTQDGDVQTAVAPAGPAPVAVTTPAVPAGPSSAQPVTPAAAPTAGVQGATPTAATDPAPGNGSASIAFELSGDSWVEIYGADGTRQFQALLHAGDRRALYGRGPWRVLLGKADHVRVLVDGRPLAPGAQFRKGETAYYHVDARGNVY